MNSAATLTTLPWAFVLSAIALAFAWRAWSKGDRAAAARRVGWALIPWSLWLIGLLSVLVRVTSSVGDWATGFVFRPTAWVGAALAVIAVLLIAVGSRGRKSVAGKRGGRKNRRLGRKKASQASVTDAGAPAANAPAPKESGRTKNARPQGKPAVSGDDDMADIEAILRRHGIE